LNVQGVRKKSSKLLTMKSSEKAAYSYIPVKNRYLSLKNLIERQENLLSTIPSIYDQKWIKKATETVEDFDSFTADGSSDWSVADRNTDLLMYEIEMQ
jgi:hypothetical protein